jgi:glycosyltransferase involved in cell wall biosynthesis
MHIAIYSTLNLSFGGGFERWISEVVPRLKNIGHEITVVTTKAGSKHDVKDGMKRILIRAGVSVCELGNYEKPLTIPKLACLKDIFDITKSADICYFNNAFAGNEILMWLVKRISGIPVCVGHHGAFPEVGRVLRRSYYSTFNRSFL